MPVPRDEEDLVPLTLQPVVDRPKGWRSRSGSAVALGLVGFIVVGLVLGTVFGGGPRQPEEAAAVPSAQSSGAGGSPRPTNRPTPTRIPRPTPLPSLEIIGGRIPTERRLVQANGFEVLDLATGTLRPVSTGADGPYIQVAGGDFVCACAVLDPTLAPGAMTLRFRRIDPDGRIVINRRILRFDDAEAVPNMTEGWGQTAALAADGRSLYVLSAIRDTANWTIRLQGVDTATGKLLANLRIQMIPVDLAEPRPSGITAPDAAPDGVYIWPNWVAVSSDGRAVFLSVNGAEVRGDAWIGRNLEWMAPIEAGVLGSPVPLAASDVIAEGQWCVSRPVFVGSILGQLCTRADGSTEALSIRRVTEAPEALEPVPLSATSFDSQTPIATTADQGRGALLVWDAGKHVLARVHLESGRSESSEVPRSILRSDDSMLEPARGYVGVDPGLVLSPDGARIYALGIGRGEREMGVSTGVWVFDAETLELLDRFEPRALLSSLAVSDDGSFVYATSPANFDSKGNENYNWPASLTVYDAATGEIQVVYGAVDPNAWLSFVQP